MKPLERCETYNNSGLPLRPEKEAWCNDKYTVFANRQIEVPNIVTDEGTTATVCWLSIKRNDRQPVTDWRDMQWIKNQLVGPENEGCELFPAESRLVDTANQYHMWVFENPKIRFPFGFRERSVLNNALIPGAVQRPFPAERTPVDIKHQEFKAIQQMLQLLIRPSQSN